MYISLILFVIFACCAAILWTEGLWGNAIRLINVITAALLAFNYFEPVARWLQKFNTNFSTFTYVWDFLSLWGLFVFFMVVFRLATDRLSKVRVKFLKPVDRGGGFVFGCVIGWIMVCFTATSLHVAPMDRDYFVGHFQPEKRVDRSPVSPEICWLAFVQMESKGAFRRSAKTLKNKRRDELVQGSWSAEEFRTFDPQGTFLPKYTTRRANLGRYNKNPQRGSGNIRIRAEWMNES